MIAQPFFPVSHLHSSRVQHLHSGGVLVLLATLLNKSRGNIIVICDLIYIRVVIHFNNGSKEG